MSQDTIIISVIALIIVIGSCIGLAKAGRNAGKSEQ
jgi:hypothetical protein